MKVLIADCDDEALKDALIDGGHQVLMAANGPDALETLSRTPCGVVIADWETSGIDGLELCRLIRERESSHYTYLILKTHRRTKQVIAEGISAGADDFLDDASDAIALNLKMRNAERMVRLNELERLNAESDEFLYLASHDLQEPTRKIAAFSELLREDIGQSLPEAAQNDIAFITDASRRLQSLIEDLLGLSRAGRRSLRYHPVALDSCAEDALDALRTQTAESNAEVTRDDLPTVCCDATLISQVYQHLIGNALRFVTDEAPRIHLSAELRGEDWILGVKDNGIGIPPSSVDQVFLPFKRLHGRAEYAGNGMGLAICRKLIERHGGQVWIESNDDAGAHVRFCLPNNSDEAASTRWSLSPALHAEHETVSAGQ